jgi:hypothetical protein
MESKRVQTPVLLVLLIVVSAVLAVLKLGNIGEFGEMSWWLVAAPALFVPVLQISIILIFLAFGVLAFLVALSIEILRSFSKDKGGKKVAKKDPGRPRYRGGC